MSYIQRFNVYSGDPDPLDTAPELEVKTTLYKGRDIVPFPKWFDISSGSIIYINCSFIKFEVWGGTETYFLVWPHNTDAQIKAHWDELKNEVVIDYTHSVKNIALYCFDRVTLLKSWTAANAPGVKPRMYIWNTSCGSGPILTCWNIPRLPSLGSNQPIATKSTELFSTCVNINGLPILP